jgi:hypothetical protein
MKERILKEGLIIAALIAVTCFINGVMFYDFSPNNSEDILHRSYAESQEVKEVLAQVDKLNSNNETKKTSGEIVDKVEITLSDAEKKANEKHATGKKNPFDNYYSAETEIETKKEKPINQSEGTFFEKKDKK